MPHTHFLLDGRRVPVQQALDEALDQWGRATPWTYPLLRAMVQRDQHESFTPSKFYGCDRSLALRLREDYAVDPARAYARLRGSLFHAILEGTATERPDYRPLVEVTLARPIRVDGTWRLVTGRIDLGDPDRGLLTDYKTTRKLWPPYPKPDDVGKLKLYRWMAEAHGITFDKGELVYVEIASGQIERSRVLIQPPNEDWIVSRIRQLVAVYDGAIPELIDLDSQWMCLGCDVAAECALQAARDGTPVPPWTRYELDKRRRAAANGRSA